MRCVGMAEVALGLLISRAKERVAFGKRLYEHGSVANDITVPASRSIRPGCCACTLPRRWMKKV
ncbi:MAG: acyl-CoA dehydrogenase family protein [Pseudomonadales bacterium]